MKIKMRGWLRWARQHVVHALALVAVCVGIFYALVYAATFKVAELFNTVMTEQQVLAGSLTVQRLEAHINGHVRFEKLVWKDPDGELIADIPEGEFQVKLLDVVRRHFTTETVQYLRIKDGFVRLEYDEDMGLVNVDRSLNREAHEQKKQRAAEARAKRREQAQRRKEQAALAAQAQSLDAQALANGRDRIKRFQDSSPEAVMARVNERREAHKRLSTKELMKQKQFVGEMHFENCKTEILWDGRTLAMDEVDADIEVNTQDRCNIRFMAPAFTGSVKADGLMLSGYVDFRTPIPEYHLNVAIDNLNPASVGMGGDLKDNMSLDAGVTGELPDPVVEGVLSLKKLDLPALHFTNLKSQVRYEEGVLTVSDLTGNVFGGTVEGKGWYNIDTQYYSADILGHGLQGDIAAREPLLKCSVELELHMRSSGDVARTVTFGQFESGKGSYYFIPFEKISGKFNNIKKRLSFEDVYIQTLAGTVKSDAFTIENGKVKMGKISMERPDRGDTLVLNE